MKWTVIWQPSAERMPAELWVKANAKKVISQAANLADAMLRNSPQEHGESRNGLERILFVFPLCILYEVIPDDMKVIVTNVYIPYGTEAP